ncbi:b9 domain-containing [Holotrichia oblita]|uniref:B9 domain-containing n=1 Tax=Holotrichia oblita TaxID=644536 RepID=A0ACB9SP41_HOLOL|nr:b9 domain-containing [Holotrichia oblita]
MTDGAFLLSINGQLEWVDYLAGAGSIWHCKYEFVAGPDWTIISGLEGGVTQIANIVRNGAKIIFNFPIEIVYKSTNPFGWPQIVISVYSGSQIKGYGRAHVPIRPGCHDLHISLSRPQPSTLLGYVGTFFGYQPELLQPKMLATTAGNYLIRMICQGKVKCSMNVLTQNFTTLGYDAGKTT